MPALFISKTDARNPKLAEQHFFNMLISEAIFCTFIAFLIFIFFREKPPTPANRSSKRKRETDYMKSLKEVLSNWNIYVLAFVYGTLIASMNIAATVGGEIVPYFGYTSK